MKKYFDTLIKDVEIPNTISPEIIHISVKGESLGERSFIGSMVHQFGPVKLSELMMKSAIIYIDDIFDADSDSLLNPEFLACYIKGVIEDSSDNWRVILTKSIERDI